MATGGLRAEHVFRVETVTATARVIEVVVRHRNAVTRHGSTGSRPAGPNQPPKQPKPARKPP
ncbi:MAG TPA: hypothetical protein VN615_02275, partial [Gaiellales bacterium]|nr:hypothetical protein [Gaiellales bacterium]